MNKSIVALIVAGLVTLTTFAAEAKKPTVCMSFVETTLPVDGVPTKVAICEDGKKPMILTSYQIITVKNEDGATVKAALGFR